MLDYKSTMIRLLEAAYFEGFCDRGPVPEEVLNENYDNSATKQLIEILGKMDDEQFVPNDIEDKEYFKLLTVDTTNLKEDRKNA